MKERIIFHIDVNNAFLSWTAVLLLKQGYKKDIRKIPSIIAGSESNRHGIVLAKSPVAKKFGIKTAETIYQAKKKCPSIEIYPPNHRWYYEQSKKLFEYLSQYSPLLEKFSIDECFLDMTGTNYLYKDYYQLAVKIKEEVKEKFGFTVNIGIGNNKLCAKMASDFEKPDKVHTLLKNEIEQTYHTEERENLPLSYDLWEECESIHLYSIASIEAALKAMLKIYELVEPDYKENRLKLENIHKNIRRIEKQLEEIPKYVAKNLYNEQTKTLKRNVTDENTDVSVIGTVVPFEMFGAKEKKILNTVEKINLTLRTYTGGYLRHERDYYRQGKDPWTITTLWMAQYYIKAGNQKKAKECLEFVVNSCNQHGLLGEQVDNGTMQPSWGIGLGWAHAMFILVIGDVS